MTDQSYFSSDTIVAIATSTASDAGVGIIRVSGKNALEVLSKVSLKPLKKIKPRYLYRIEIIDKLNSSEVIDDGLFVYFANKHSFTGEDVVEFQLHGGRYLLNKTLAIIINTQLARLAKPGEFSFRSVQNNKMSIQKAQSLAKLILANSDFEIKAIKNNFSEKRIKCFNQIIDKIRNLLAKVELSIDFIDQDVEVFSFENFISELLEVINQLEEIKNIISTTHKIIQGINIALVGLPNAGKSTLFNAILTEDRSIVSNLPGTTRDVVSEQIIIRNYKFNFLDTAGIRNTEETIEKIGISKSISTLEKCDVALIILDINQELSINEKFLEQFTSSMFKKSIIFLNKTDLLDSVQSNALAQLISKKYNVKTVLISAIKNSSNVAVIDAIFQKLSDNKFLISEPFFPSEFQNQLINKCKNNLIEIKVLLQNKTFDNPEIISTLLRNAANSLSDVVGETTPDLILNKIFSEFCIGK